MRIGSSAGGAYVGLRAMYAIRADKVRAMPAAPAGGADPSSDGLSDVCYLAKARWRVCGRPGEQGPPLGRPGGG